MERYTYPATMICNTASKRKSKLVWDIGAEWQLVLHSEIPGHFIQVSLMLDFSVDAVLNLVASGFNFGNA